MNSDQFADELDHLDRSNLRRRLVPIASGADAEVEVDGRRLLMLASNNYLGLATHPALRAAAAAAAERYGTGAGASRLVTGDLAIHHELEERLAHFKHTQAALCFTSGYQANIGAITTL